MNKTDTFKSSKKNTEHINKESNFTQNNDCNNTRDLQSVQLLVLYLF